MLQDCTFHFLPLISADGSPAPPLPQSPILASEVQGRLFLDLHYLVAVLYPLIPALSTYNSEVMFVQEIIGFIDHVHSYTTDVSLHM